MAYPLPPGTSNSSLPPRPPASQSGFKPAFKPAFTSSAQPASSKPAYANTPSSYAGPAGYPAAQYGVSSYPTGGVSAPPPAPYSSYSQQQPQGYGPQSYGPQTYGAAPAYAAAPSIRNPFPTPGTAASTDFDPEMAAQIAQWQSAYVSRDAVDPKTGKPVGPEAPRPDAQSAAAAAAAAATASNNERKKTVVREGGGKKWTDDSLLEWDPSHLRLFVGNLAGETTDDALLKAFARWKSVQKARVIRDKRTSKSKGYGFVSFSDADDFFQAAKEMNGKYIQSHPVVIRKANTEIKVANVKDKDKGKHNKKNKKHGGSGSGGGGNYRHGGYEPSLGPVANGGVTKPGQKTKNGLRLLG